MDRATTHALSLDELEGQHTAELPARDLLATVSLLGIPLVGVSDVTVHVDTSGPGWLIGSI